MNAPAAEYMVVRDEVTLLHSRKEDLLEGDLVHRLGRFDRYVLASVPVANLNLSEFDLDEDKVTQYVEQFKATGIYPRIVFDAVDESIIDGLHRANALARCGLTEIDAYLGTRENLDPDWAAGDDAECDDEEPDYGRAYALPSP